MLKSGDGTKMRGGTRRAQQERRAPSQPTGGGGAAGFLVQVTLLLCLKYPTCSCNSFASDPYGDVA